ncbi:MAG: DUF4368 domain-containing protein [Defluviitaleaceae bacterium]|nr:DUF4368 domain-containing protein [Defluviitaleaceae bacterium]
MNSIIDNVKDYYGKRLREIEKLQRYADITELNRTIVTSLIKSIHISEPTEIDGEKQYEVEIRYKFQNALNAKKKTRLPTSFQMVYVLLLADG